MYLLKLAFRPWRLALLSQLFSSLAVGFLLLLIGFLFWMQQGLKSVLVRLQTDQVITAYLDVSQTSLPTDHPQSHPLPHKEEQRIVNEIKQSVGDQHTTEVKLVNAPQFISLLKNHYPDLGRELEQLGSEMNQVVPRYVSISGSFSSSVLEKIQKIPGVESAESSRDRYRPVLGAFSALRWVARVLMAGICFALLTGLIHLIRMNSYLHQDALSLLKLWGAGSVTLASPSVISGSLVGLLGGMIAWGGWMTLGRYLVHHVRTLSSLLKEMPTKDAHLALTLWVMGGLLGFLAGWFGGGAVSPAEKLRSARG